MLGTASEMVLREGSLWVLGGLALVWLVLVVARWIDEANNPPKE